MRHFLVLCNKYQSDDLMTLSELYYEFKFFQLPDTRDIPVIPSPVIPAQGRTRQESLPMVVGNLSLSRID